MDFHWFDLVAKNKSLNDLLLGYQSAFLVLVLVSGALGGAGIYSWSQIHRESLRINAMLEGAQEMRGHLYRQMKEVLDAAFLADAEARPQYRYYADLIEDHLQTLEARAEGAEERTAIARLREAYNQVKTRADKIIAGPAIETPEERRRVFDTDLELTAFNEYEAAFDAIDRLLALSRNAIADRLATLNRLAPFLLIVPLLLAVGLLLLSRNFLQRAVIVPLNKLLRATNEISRGDLTQKIPETGAAELATLSQAFNHMAAELAGSRDLLVRAEKAATLSALVPVVAHNIRNPLSSIRATAQVLDDPGLSGEVREGLNGIINAADRLEEWTRSLLSYLHPLTPQLNRCTLTQIADDALRLLTPKLAAKSIEVKREGWDKAPEQELDVQLLEQALTGLLGNAIDASPSRGRITLALVNSDARIKLSLIDEGGGMPFTPEPDELAPGPTTKRHGTGLGIPFAMKICEVHGGRIEFSSSGEGTSVDIILPLS